MTKTMIKINDKINYIHSVRREYPNNWLAILVCKEDGIPYAEHKIPKTLFDKGGKCHTDGNTYIINR